MEMSAYLFCILNICILKYNVEFLCFPIFSYLHHKVKIVFNMNTKRKLVISRTAIIC